jgi:predicted nucleotidyltransferase
MCPIYCYIPDVDYVRPVEAVIPGAQGRVLGVLSRTETELTMRTVARLAGVSVSRAADVLNRLVSLGLVERREAGPSALVALAHDNEAARAVLALAGLRDAVVTRLRLEARTVEPVPASLVVFGSFPIGEAREGSDIDVLAVRAAGVRADNPGWVDSVGRWVDRAREIAGNPVNLLEASLDEMPELLGRRGSVWEAAAQNGVLLAGDVLDDLRSRR